MNDSPEHQRLLADVLKEQTEADFRSALLGQTLRRVRRRRVTRTTLRATCACAAVVGLLMLSWHWRLPQQPPLAASVRHYRLVETQPLAPEAVVRTATFQKESLATSTPTIAIITTAGANPVFPRLTDEELLALAPPAALLVRHEDHSAELRFADSVDQSLPH